MNKENESVIGRAYQAMPDMEIDLPDDSEIESMAFGFLGAIAGDESGV